MTQSPSFEEWDFPGEMKITLRRRAGRIHEVLYNDRLLPPYAQDSVRVDFPDGTVNLTMTFIGLTVVIEDDAVVEGLE